MDNEKYTTVTVDRKTLEGLKSTNENKRSANILIQDLIELHNDCKLDTEF